MFDTIPLKYIVIFFFYITVKTVTKRKIYNLFILLKTVLSREIMTKFTLTFKDKFMDYGQGHITIHALHICKLNIQVKHFNLHKKVC